MLYEVITFPVFQPFFPRPDKKHPPPPPLSGVTGASTITAPAGSTITPFTRITSYNVCYTKLLRAAVRTISADALPGDIPGTLPLDMINFRLAVAENGGSALIIVV